MAVNPKPQVQTQKKICKVTKHETRIKIYKAQQNLRWSVSRCQNFDSFLTVFVHPLWMMANLSLVQKDFDIEFFHQFVCYTHQRFLFSGNYYFTERFCINIFKLVHWRYVFIQPNKKFHRKLESIPLQALQMLQVRTFVSLYLPIWSIKNQVNKIC